MPKVIQTLSAALSLPLVSLFKKYVQRFEMLIWDKNEIIAINVVGYNEGTVRES